MKVLFVTPNLENNSLGRTHSLWMLAEYLGWASTVVAVKGTEIWSPLAGTDFHARCISFAGDTRHHLPSDPLPPRLITLARDADVLVAVKPLLPSFGVARRLSAHTGRPLVLDIDDPDFEVRTSSKPRYEQAARWVLKPEYRALQRLGRSARRIPRMVSNPELQRNHGGVVIPHVRPVMAPRAATALHRTEVIVRFVGSARPHKGIPDLREAVGRLADRGFRLEVTATPPADAKPWETWHGVTSMTRGAQLVATADVVAIPSRVDPWSSGQLPAKLIDAMMASAAVVASRVGPIPWALGGTGVLVPPGDVAALTAALGRLADPCVRRDLGMRARDRAIATFSVPTVAPAFAEVIEAAGGQP